MPIILNVMERSLLSLCYVRNGISCREIKRSAYGAVRALRWQNRLRRAISMDGRSVSLALEPQDGRAFAPRKSERGRAMAKVSIIGAGNVGATAASHIVALGLADVVLLDINEGIARGKALDMMHMCSVLDSGLKVRGTSDYTDTTESDVVVITAGVARKPGMTREDLLATNASIMTSSVRQAIALSPNAIVICVSNPLNVTTDLACSHGGIPASRVIGMGGRAP